MCDLEQGIVIKFAIVSWQASRRKNSPKHALNFSVCTNSIERLNDAEKTMMNEVLKS